MARARNTDSQLDPAVEEVKKQIQRAEEAYHNQWALECDRRHDAYHAFVENDWDPDDWHSHIFPPHLVPVIEGMIAAMVEGTPHLRVRPRPRPLELPDEVMMRVDASEVAEVAVNWAMENDDFVLKQRPFIHQDMICGFTAAKYHWEEQTKTMYERVFYDVEEDDEDGQPQTRRGSDTFEYDEKVRDDPTLTVIDVRDFFWPANCRDIAKADWLADRQYMSLERVQNLEDLGVYDEGTTEKLRESSLPQQGKPGERRRYDEGGSSGPLRTTGLVEVIERWTTGGVCTIGNRQVLMREGENTFWHGGMPYVTCTAIPNPFQVNGQSIVDVLAPIQQMLWFISNQSLDNLKLLNNLIILIRDDTENASGFVWRPGAQWLVTDPEQVKSLEIDPTPATISLQRESLLKGELQNLMGALPGTGNVDSQTIDQKTATGISIITNIAQQVIQTRKLVYQMAFARVGRAFLDLMQQFMLEPRTVAILGEGGAHVLTEIDPARFQGAFDVAYDIQGDSLVRQERRAEAQAMYQMLTQAAPLQAQFGTPFNLDVIAEKLLKAFDVPNPKIFFLTPEQAQQKMSPAGGPGAPPGIPGQQDPAEQMVQNGNAGAGPMGSPGNAVTAPPGAGVSTSPMTQQFMAPTGPQQ